MRWLALLVVAGCGRLDFTPDIDARPIDAMIDATRAVDCTIDPDGTPCDDRNICTASSSCQAGVCTPAQPKASCTVADSTNDFDTTQGVNGWYYGFWDAEGDPSYDPTSDFYLGVYDGTFSFTTPANTMFLYMASWGAHPRFGPLRIPVRRWVSNVQGPAIAHLHFDKSDKSCGDGVEGRLVVDGLERFAQSIAFDDGVGVDAPIPVELVVGTLVEIHLRPNASDSCDTSNTTLTISSP